MSKFCNIKTTFKDEPALISALMESGPWTKEQIEIHAEPQHMYGYHGDRRTEKAHIIVRRQFIGGSSNDIGFEKLPDGSYKAIISEYDLHRFNPEWRAKLKENYAFVIVDRQQRARGRSVSRITLPNGNRGLAVEGYR